MARPERNTVDYFPFFCDEGKKMFYIEETYGNDGFATFVKILRELAKTEYHYIDLSNVTTQMFLSAKCKVSKETLLSIINDLSELGKFNNELWNNYKIIWCQDFINSIEDAYKKRLNKCITFEGLRILLRSKGILIEGKSTLKVSINTQIKEKKRKVNKSKEEYSENAKILNEFSRTYFDEKYINDKSLDMFDKLLLKYSIEQVKTSIINAKSDMFWNKNFLSPLKLISKDKTGVSYIDVFLNIKSEIKTQVPQMKARFVHYKMYGRYYTHHEKAYNENIKSCGAENIEFINYVDNGN